MINILFISPKSPIPANDGGKISVFGTIKYLSKLGHKITYLTYLQTADYNESISELSKYCDPIIVKKKTSYTIWGMIKNFFSKVPYNIWKYKTVEFENTLLDVLSTRKFDLVHVHILHMAWVEKIIREHQKCPVILREDNFELKIMERFYRETKNPFIKIYAFLQFKKFTKYEPETCQRFDRCIMISGDDKKELLKYDPLAEPDIIPLGVEEDLFHYNRKEIKKLTIAHIGSLNWRPNINGLRWFVSKVFPSVISEFPDCRLLIYAGGSSKKIATSSLVKNNIKWIGYVDDLWEELSKISLAIVPLRIGSGMRLKVVELLAIGINVLTTSIGKEGIPVEDEKHILIADNAKDFHEKIRKFFNGEYNNENMIAESRAVIRANYSWKVIAKQFENIYLEELSNIK